MYGFLGGLLGFIVVEQPIIATQAIVDYAACYIRRNFFRFKQAVLVHINTCSGANFALRTIEVGWRFAGEGDGTRVYIPTSATGRQPREQADGATKLCYFRSDH